MSQSGVPAKPSGGVLAAPRAVAIASDGHVTVTEELIRVVLGTKPIAEQTRRFLTKKLVNPRTRDNYVRSTVDFLGWCYENGFRVDEITGEHLDHYRDRLLGRYDVPTVNNKLSGISKYFKLLSAEHIIRGNPVDDIERPKLKRDGGTTPLIPVQHAEELLNSIDTSTVIGKRDKAVLGILTYSGLRVGAIANLKLESFAFDGTQYLFNVIEKGGKDRSIPVRHDLEQWVHDYIRAAGIAEEPKGYHLFRSVVRKTGMLAPYSPADPDVSGSKAKGNITANDIYRMLKRRLAAAKLPTVYSCHSFRAMSATDLIDQGVPIEEVRDFLGHADTRTTELYNRKPRDITRNLVERISVKTKTPQT